jgi:hypothetical protein
LPGGILTHGHAIPTGLNHQQKKNCHAIEDRQDRVAEVIFELDPQIIPRRMWVIKECKRLFERLNANGL